MKDDRFRNPWTVLGLSAALLALAFVVGFVLLSHPAPALSLDAASSERPEDEQGSQAGAGAGPIQLPLRNVERLVVMGRYEACALGGREVACTRDGGESWDALGPLPSPVITAASAGRGHFLFASLDGTLYEASAASEPEPLLSLPAEFALVDAAARDDRLILLAQRYDEPDDPLERLPRVLETLLFEVLDDGSLQELGGIPGFGGDQLLLQGDDSLITFASVDQRAWQSRDGGRTLRRIPDKRRFGRDFDGLQATVERKPERLPGPGRPARPASALWLSHDLGETWEQTFETPGELLVDFADRRLGMAIARGEGVAWVTHDGGASFEPLLHDDRIDGAVDLAWLGGRFLAVTKDGLALDLDPDQKRHPDQERRRARERPLDQQRK